MMNFIVLAVVVFAIVFVVVWAVSPNLRVWIERPKYRFLAESESYDARTYDGAAVRHE